MNIEQFFDKMDKIYHNNTIEFFFIVLLIFIAIVLIGPIISFLNFIIKIIFKFLYFIFIFNWNFIFGKNKKDNKKNKEITPQISINNQSSDLYNNKDLTLIEMKILEINQKEHRNSHHNLIKLELNQHKLENKIELNEQKNYFEKKMLEQQIKFLEKEIEKIKKEETKKINENENNKNKEKEINKQNNKKENEKDKDLAIIDEDLVKQIPDYLKEIFYKIKNLENIQFYILNNIIKNPNSYYDEDKNTFYINPKDLVFVKKILNTKKEKNKKLMN
ncbi:hypothetical protein [Candidatus Phytoplasma oryzae]|nr:hypothetical protein PIE28_01005 [Candidatus Phytoplasma oryzae]